MIDSTSIAARREKHVEIHEAIEGLDSIVRHLEEFYYRVQEPTPHKHPPIDGQTSHKDPSTDGIREFPPSLLELLNGGAGAIREKTDEAHKGIEQIMDMLF